MTIFGVDVEGSHDVLAVVVEVGEVGEVAGVVDGDGVAGLLEKTNEIVGPSSLVIQWCVGVLEHQRLRLAVSMTVATGSAGKGAAGDERGGVFQLVGGEAVEDVGQALGFGVLGGEVVGAVAAGYACAERGDDAVDGKAGEAWRVGRERRSRPLSSA